MVRCDASDRARDSLRALTDISPYLSCSKLRWKRAGTGEGAFEAVDGVGGSGTDSIGGVATLGICVGGAASGFECVMGAGAGAGGGEGGVSSTDNGFKVGV